MFMESGKRTSGEQMLVQVQAQADCKS